MNGSLIPHTPIAVDFWRVTKCPQAKIFFLTHLHGDHTCGLTPTWSRDIYCTPITKGLLNAKLQIREELIHALAPNESHIVKLDEEDTESMTVTVIDAHHCPGSAMFLFQGYFGTVLHTGDFRYTEKMFIEEPLSQKTAVDILYLDNTYSSPECNFPTRPRVMEEVFEILDRHPDHEVLVGMRSLGKEDLLVAMAFHIQSWVVVSPEQYELLCIMDMPNVFTTDRTAGRIHVILVNHLTPATLRKWNSQQPTIGIIPTALHTGSKHPYQSRPDMFVIPYSDHSSYSELHRFVERVKPKKIIPIVSAKSRGPYGRDISERADMQVYRKYLNLQPIEPFEIPQSVERYMHVNNFDINKRRNKAGKRKRIKCPLLGRKRKVVMGVSYEEQDDEVDKPDVSDIKADVDIGKKDVSHSLLNWSTNEQQNDKYKTSKTESKARSSIAVSESTYTEGDRMNCEDKDSPMLHSPHGEQLCSVPDADLRAENSSIWKLIPVTIPLQKQQPVWSTIGNPLCYFNNAFLDHKSKQDDGLMKEELQSDNSRNLLNSLDLKLRNELSIQHLNSPTECPLPPDLLGIEMDDLPAFHGPSLLGSGEESNVQANTNVARSTPSIGSVLPLSINRTPISGGSTTFPSDIEEFINTYTGKVGAKMVEIPLQNLCGSKHLCENVLQENLDAEHCLEETSIENNKDIRPTNGCSSPVNKTGHHLHSTDPLSASDEQRITSGYSELGTSKNAPLIDCIVSAMNGHNGHNRNNEPCQVSQEVIITGKHLSDSVFYSHVFNDKSCRVSPSSGEVSGGYANMCDKKHPVNSKQTLAINLCQTALKTDEMTANLDGCKMTVQKTKVSTCMTKGNKPPTKAVLGKTCVKSCALRPKPLVVSYGENGNKQEQSTLESEMKRKVIKDGIGANEGVTCAPNLGKKVVRDHSQESKCRSNPENLNHRENESIIEKSQKGPNNFADIDTFSLEADELFLSDEEKKYKVKSPHCMFKEITNNPREKVLPPITSTTARNSDRKLSVQIRCDALPCATEIVEATSTVLSSVHRVDPPTAEMLTVLYQEQKDNRQSQNIVRNTKSTSLSGHDLNVDFTSGEDSVIQSAICDFKRQNSSTYVPINTALPEGHTAIPGEVSSTVSDLGYQPSVIRKKEVDAFVRSDFHVSDDFKEPGTISNTTRIKEDSNLNDKNQTKDVIETNMSNFRNSLPEVTAYLPNALVKNIAQSIPISQVIAVPYTTTGTDCSVENISENATNSLLGGLTNTSQTPCKRAHSYADNNTTELGYFSHNNSAIQDTHNHGNPLPMSFINMPIDPQMENSACILTANQLSSYNSCPGSDPTAAQGTAETNLTSTIYTVSDDQASTSNVPIFKGESATPNELQSSRKSASDAHLCISDEELSVSVKKNSGKVVSMARGKAGCNEEYEKFLLSRYGLDPNGRAQKMKTPTLVSTNPEAYRTVLLTPQEASKLLLRKRVKLPENQSRKDTHNETTGVASLSLQGNHCKKKKTQIPKAAQLETENVSEKKNVQNTKVRHGKTKVSTIDSDSARCGQSRRRSSRNVLKKKSGDRASGDGQNSMTTLLRIKPVKKLKVIPSDLSKEDPCEIKVYDTLGKQVACFTEPTVPYVHPGTATSSDIKTNSSASSPIIAPNAEAKLKQVTLSVCPLSFPPRRYSLSKRSVYPINIVVKKSQSVSNRKPSPPRRATTAGSTKDQQPARPKPPKPNLKIPGPVPVTLVRNPAVSTPRPDVSPAPYETSTPPDAANSEAVAEAVLPKSLDPTQNRQIQIIRNGSETVGSTDPLPISVKIDAPGAEDIDHLAKNQLTSLYSALKGSKGKEASTFPTNSSERLAGECLPDRTDVVKDIPNQRQCQEKHCGQTLTRRTTQNQMSPGNTTGRMFSSEKLRSVNKSETMSKVENPGIKQEFQMGKSNEKSPNEPIYDSRRMRTVKRESEMSKPISVPEAGKSSLECSGNEETNDLCDTQGKSGNSIRAFSNLTPKLELCQSEPNLSLLSNQQRTKPVQRAVTVPTSTYGNREKCTRNPSKVVPILRTKSSDQSRELHALSGIAVDQPIPRRPQDRSQNSKIRPSMMRVRKKKKHYLRKRKSPRKSVPNNMSCAIEHNVHYIQPLPPVFSDADADVESILSEEEGQGSFMKTHSCKDAVSPENRIFTPPEVNNMDTMLISGKENNMFGKRIKCLEKEQLDMQFSSPQMKGSIKTNSDSLCDIKFTENQIDWYGIQSSDHGGVSASDWDMDHETDRHDKTPTKLPESQFKADNKQKVLFSKSDKHKQEEDNDSDTIVLDEDPMKMFLPPRELADKNPSGAVKRATKDSNSDGRKKVRKCKCYGCPDCKSKYKPALLQTSPHTFVILNGFQEKSKRSGGPSTARKRITASSLKSTLNRKKDISQNNPMTQKTNCIPKSDPIMYSKCKDITPAYYKQMSDPKQMKRQQKCIQKSEDRTYIDFSRPQGQLEVCEEKSFRRTRKFTKLMGSVTDSSRVSPHDSLPPSMSMCVKLKKKCGPQLRTRAIDTKLTKGPPENIKKRFTNKEKIPKNNLGSMETKDSKDRRRKDMINVVLLDGDELDVPGPHSKHALGRKSL